MKKFLIAFLFFLSVVCSASATTTYYVDYTSGLDSNNGTSKATPFQHAPGMKGCTSNCSTATLSAGLFVILKGGVSWPASTLCWDLEHYPNSAPQNYIGVDKTWFTGASWTRPALDAQSTDLGNCVVNSGSTTIHNIMVVLNSNYITLDNIEFKGFLSLVGSESNMINGSFGPDFFIIENCFFHGWSTPAGSLSADPLQIFYRSPGYAITSGVIDSNIVDGFDTPEVQADPNCTGACQATGLFYYGFATVFKKNVIRYVSNGFVGDVPIAHDNLFEYVRVSTNPTNHENNFENNSDCNARFYNNVARHWNSTSIVGIWLSPSVGCTDYAFNNVVYDGANANAWDMAPNEGCPGGCTPPFGTMYNLNNTVEPGPDSSPAGQMSVADPNMAGATAANNQQISSTLSFQNCPTGNCTVNNNVFQSKSTATTAGYSTSTAQAFFPTIGTGPTVNTGVNYSSRCIIDSDMANLCSSTTYAVSYSTDSCSNLTCWNADSHTITWPAVTPTTRPASGNWNIGAFQITGTGNPSPPSSVTNSNGGSVGAHTVTITWSPSVTSGVSYFIFRGTASGQESGTPLNMSGVGTSCTGPAGGCTYTDSTVIAGQNLFYTVEAYNGTVYSAPSNEISTTVPVSAPTGLVISH